MAFVLCCSLVRRVAHPLTSMVVVVVSLVVNAMAVNASAKHHIRRRANAGIGLACIVARGAIRDGKRNNVMHAKRRTINVGSFNVASGKLVVAEDQCVFGELAPARNGEWSAIVTVVYDDDGFKPLCAELLVHVVPIDTTTKWQRTSFGAGTEGGIAGIWDSDSCARVTADDFDEFGFTTECANVAIREFDDRPIVQTQEQRFNHPPIHRVDGDVQLTQAEQDALSAWCAAHDQRTQEVVEARVAWAKTDAAVDAGIVAKGVVSASGHGDGSYPCEYVMVEDAIVATRIVFIDDSDDLQLENSNV